MTLKDFIYIYILSLLSGNGSKKEIVVIKNEYHNIICDTIQNSHKGYYDNYILLWLVKPEKYPHAKSN